MFGLGNKSAMPSADQALPGRAESMPVEATHYVNGHAMEPPYPDTTQVAMFGLGCFWGAERIFWQAEGVFVSAAGYAAGHTPNPTYQEVCSGMTGHNEVVRVVFNPQQTSYEALLKLFWESHNPTQGMRQGNDTGTQYRSGIYVYSDQQMEQAQHSREIFQKALHDAGMGDISTEIIQAPEFYFAEAYHQQYLARNPNGYCGLGGCNVKFPQV